MTGLPLRSDSDTGNSNGAPSLADASATLTDGGSSSSTIVKVSVSNDAGTVTSAASAVNVTRYVSSNSSMPSVMMRTGIARLSKVPGRILKVSEVGKKSTPEVAGCVPVVSSVLLMVTSIRLPLTALIRVRKVFAAFST